MKKPIVYFDLESDSLESNCQIIQIAAVAMQDGEILNQFESKLQFDSAIANPEALKINGYSADAWQNAERPIIAVKRFAKWLEPYKHVKKISKKTGKEYFVAQLAGYNAAFFDAPRLQHLFQSQGIFLPADLRVLDVMQLAMWYFEVNPENRPNALKLSSVCEFFGVPLTNAHNALDDVIATAQLAEILTQKDEVKTECLN